MSSKMFYTRISNKDNLAIIGIGGALKLTENTPGLDIK